MLYFKRSKLIFMSSDLVLILRNKMFCFEINITVDFKDQLCERLEEKREDSMVSRDVRLNGGSHGVVAR